MPRAHTTSQEGFVPLVAKMKAAKRIDGQLVDPKVFDADAVFVLSPEAADSVESLAERESALKDPAHIKMPYDTVIVEKPVQLEDQLNVRTGTKPIARVAAKIIVAGEGLAYFWAFWEFTDGTLSAAAYTALVQGGSFPMLPLHARMHNLSVSLIPSPAILAQISRAPPEEAERRLRLFHKLGHDRPDLRLQAVEDVKALLFAWETIVHCKSGVTRTVVPPRKAVAGFGRRKKIAANTGYTVVSLTAVEDVSPQGVTSQRADVEAHLVRGHFKRRKSGVFWWSPYVRGTGELKHRTAYIMEGAPA